MSNAGLRIKFIPVMKGFHKDNSICCLEIVPEISGVQNFEQIEWKEENNLIEYTIPMTYKIIIKKLPQQTITQINANLNKMYYSCVDLLIPSSIAKFNLASGDIKRIISDSYIVTKVTVKLDHNDDTQKPLLNLNGEYKKQTPANNQNTNDTFKEQIIDSLVNEVEIREDIKKPDKNDKESEDTSSLDTVNVNRQSIDKITNTESDFALCTDVCTQSGETITCISTIMNSSKENSNRRLSQTPVCSVDADIIKENLSHNSVIYYINEPNKDTTCIANICAFNNIYNENYKKFKVLTRQMNVDRNFTNNLKEFSGIKRILPEVRVAELVQIMEKEILPLKILLNEILSKCATLGTVWKKHSQFSLMYKPIDSKCNDRVIQSCKKHIKSNRVVYSIVFDD